MDWTLHDAVARALTDNLELRMESRTAEAADAALRGARADFDPTLSASVGWDRYEGAGVSGGLAWSAALAQPLPTGGTAGVSWGQGRAWTGDPASLASLDASSAVTVSQPLLDGAWAAARYGIDLERLGVRGAQLVWRSRAEGLVVEVANAYWGLVSAREYARLAHKSVEIAELQLAQTRERFGEGFAGSGDVLQVERALGVSRQSAAVADAAESGAVRRLARLMGVGQDPAPELSPVDRPGVAQVEPDAATVLAAASDANTAMRLVRLSVDEARLEARHAVNAALPDVTVAGSLGLSAPRPSPYDDPERAWAVGATLTTPLSPQGPLAGIRASRLALERAELGYDAARQDLAVDVDAAVQAVRRDRARVDFAAQTLSAAEQGLAADQDLYKEGRGSTRDVVRSLESLEEAQVAQLDAAIDLQASLLELHRITGDVFGWVGVGEPDALKASAPPPR